MLAGMEESAFGFSHVICANNHQEFGTIDLFISTYLVVVLMYFLYFGHLVSCLFL